MESCYTTHIDRARYTVSLDGVGSGRFGKPAGRLAKVEAAGAVTCAIQGANFQKGFGAGSQRSSSATMTWLLVDTDTTDHHAAPLFQPLRAHI